MSEEASECAICRMDDVPLRPFGPHGSAICFRCAVEPERLEETKDRVRMCCEGCWQAVEELTRGDGSLTVTIPGTPFSQLVRRHEPCIVCKEQVEPGTGRVSTPPFPAIHDVCVHVAFHNPKGGYRN